jgi:hypothetical protein
LAVTLGVRSALKTQYAAERHRIETEGRARRTTEIAAVWNQLNYTDVASPDFTERFLSLTNWRALALTALQEARLRERLADVVAYLREPSLDRYVRLKMEGLYQTFELSAMATQVLAHADLKLPLNSLAPEEAVEQLWRAAVIGTNANASPSRITAICLDRVRVALSHTNSPATVFAGPVRQGFTVAKAAIDPGFRYGPPVNGSTSSDQGFFVLLSFFARSNHSTNASPVYLSLAWSEADRRWVSSRLFTDVLLNFNLLF